MQTRKGHRRIRAANQRCLCGVLAVLIIGASTGCALRDPWEDARIEGEVKAGLVAKKAENLTQLGVVSRQAVVYLTGTVASPEEKAVAEAVARDVAGVRKVVNSLEVRAPARTEPTTPRRDGVRGG